MMKFAIAEVHVVGETKRGLPIRKARALGEVFESEADAIARYRELNEAHTGRFFGYYVVD